jgi:hypothetical protein
MKQEEAEIAENLTLTAKYSGKQIEIIINSDSSYLELKLKLQQGFKFFFLKSSETNILPKRQKIMGLTTIKFEDEKTTLSTLKVKNSTKFILIGTPEKEIQEVSKTIKNNNIIDDFDEDYFPDAEDVKNAQKYNDKLMKRLDQVNHLQTTQR